MPIDYSISPKKRAVKKFLQTKYQLNTNSLSNLDTFLDYSIQGIIAIKIWKNKLQSNTPMRHDIYLDEIISNLNQVIILTPLGFTIPSSFLIRRSYENLLAYIFYKDHPIEFFVKEHDDSAKFKKSIEFESYFKEFPFQFYYPNIDKEQCRNLITELVKDKSDQYSELSKYVHGQNENYLELISMLNEIFPDDRDLERNTKAICEFFTFSNSILLLFSFNQYHLCSPEEKQIIRLSIHGGHKRYKDKIRRIFGEI